NVVFTISAGNSGPVLQSTGSPSVASQAISVGAAVTDWDLDHPVDETQHGELGEVRPEAASAGATAIASFSSRGPTGDRLIKPELTAPGAYFIAAESSEGAEVAAADLAHRHDYSADPTYAVLSGTSMSAPAAAGAAALVWDAYQEFVGADPRYFEVKAALANTAGTHAFEGPIVGLISGIRAKNLGDDPDELFPIRNADWVGVSGEGSGRINAPAAALAITQGVLAYTPQAGELDDIHELQPNWALDDVAPGESAVQPFVLHPGPGLRGARVTFSVDAGTEPEGVLAAPASWFKLARRPVRVHPGTDAHVQLKLEVPADAAPGTYAATIVGQARLDKQTVQNVRIPVQFFVPVVDDDPAEGAGVAVEGPIWASEPTDYSIPGFYNPLGDIFTDWATFPLRLTEGTQRVDLSVYDVEGLDHMDVFVFDENGVEVDSTVSFFLHHSVPGGAVYAPTTADAPARISLFDGDDATDVVLPATVWIAVSDSGPDQLGFSTFHLDVDVLSDGTGGGTVPAERIHSGTHAWWSGSVNDADGTLTREVAVPAGAGELRFFTWYNLEEGFDWAYVLVSADGGATWTSLVTTAPNGSGTTTLDPMGDTGNVLGGSKRYPNGLTGVSGQPAFLSGGLLSPEMTEHTADLTPYEGGTVLLRFAYTSDGGVNLENIYVDDVSIVDASGTALFLDDMEEGGTWTSEGTPGWAWVTA
ncbi:MAG: S8 family serine peptidase, partial [Actinobacteria bacterium]|nr:S8 family serine peptidase [Actinomycetota bacterium]